MKNTHSEQRKKFERWTTGNPLKGRDEAFYAGYQAALSTAATPPVIGNTLAEKLILISERLSGWAKDAQIHDGLSQTPAIMEEAGRIVYKAAMIVAAPTPPERHTNLDAWAMEGMRRTIERLQAENERLERSISAALTPPEVEPIDKTKVGLFHKFNVTRTDGKSSPSQQHHGCDYFVLDITHDPYAPAALAAYAQACAAFPLLSEDLRNRYRLPETGLAGYVHSSHANLMDNNGKVIMIPVYRPHHIPLYTSPPSPKAEYDENGNPLNLMAAARDFIDYFEAGADVDRSVEQVMAFLQKYEDNLRKFTGEEL